MTLRGRLAQLKCAVPAVIMLAAVGITFQFSGVRVNASASLPIGLYKTTTNVNAKLVEFCPAEPFASISVSRGYRSKGNCPDGGEPLMKPVIATAGDVVEISAQGVTVNTKLLPNSAALLFDSKGRPMLHYPFGKCHVAAGTVWIISSFNQRSFDSRYFGPILVSSIRSHLQPLLTE